MDQVAKKACVECPFRKTSISGWLGNAEGPMDFLAPHWYAGLKLPCHMMVEWEDGMGGVSAEEAPHCRGLFHMMNNACKLHDNSDYTELQKSVGRDSDFFTFPKEFVLHHESNDLEQRRNEIAILWGLHPDDDAEEIDEKLEFNE